MLLLRVTSDPALHGVSTDDGFTIGRVSSATLFLLGVIAALGMAGGLFYLAVRRWIPPSRPARGPASRLLRGAERYSAMFFVTTSIVSFSSAVGLNSTISVLGKISGVWPGPT